MDAFGMSPPAKTTIGVMGSGSDEHETLVQPVGALLARLEVNLLTGAGQGVMAAVSAAYTSSPRTRGVCIGIVPCKDETRRATPKDGYPNRFVELPIFTHLPLSGDDGQHDLSRNHINILSCAAIVALPGGSGTASEVDLAIKYDKPIIGFGEFEQQLAHYHPRLKRVFDIEEVESFLRDYVG